MSIPHQNTAKKRNQGNQNRCNAHTFADMVDESINVRAAIRIFRINLFFHFLLIENMRRAEFDPCLDEFAVVLKRFDTYIYVQKKHRRKDAPDNRNQ